MQDFNIDNYMALDVLEALSIDSPTQKQVDIVEAIVANNRVPNKMFYISNLSHREKACLYWSAQGKTTIEIAKILATEPKTVNSCKRDLISKINTNNKAKSIIPCLKLGHIKTASLS